MIDERLPSRPASVVRVRADELAVLAALDALEPPAVPLGDRIWRVVRPIVTGVGR